MYWRAARRLAFGTNSADRNRLFVPADTPSPGLSPTKDRPRLSPMSRGRLSVGGTVDHEKSWTGRVREDVKLSEGKKSREAARAEREARKAFREADATEAMTEREASEKAFADNRQRLRKERIAREAAAGPILAPAPELPDATLLERVILSSRTQNALREGGFKTVGEVREATDETLLSLQDLGKGSVSELRAKLGLASAEGVQPPNGKNSSDSSRT